MSLQISKYNGCVSVSGKGISADFYGTEDEAMRQARLFAAAADLLAAGKRILDALIGSTGELRSAQHALARAIAKAEGV